MNLASGVVDELVELVVDPLLLDECELALDASPASLAVALGLLDEEPDDGEYEAALLMVDWCLDLAK